MRSIARNFVFAIIVISMNWVGAAGVEPTDNAAKTATGQRTAEQIQYELDDLGHESAVQSALGSTKILTDEAKRSEVATAALPKLKQMLKLTDELAATEKGKDSAERLRQLLISVLIMLGDAETQSSLERATAGDDEQAALTAKIILLQTRWWKACKNADEQGNILAEATHLAKAAPGSKTIAQALITMSQIGAATPQLRDQAMTIISRTMNDDVVETFKDRISSLQKLYSLENKPLVIQGLRNDGTNFTTADWKGKVILVDFWATWCGPCTAELPRVKQAYANFHTKGFEVVGVSCDNDGADLKKFLEQHTDMPWPQLFDEKTKGWHPLASQYGITGIPAMFLIDKKGIVRTVDAGDKLETTIDQLLEE